MSVVVPLEEPAVSGGGGTGRLRPPAAGARQDRRGLRRLSGKRAVALARELAARHDGRASAFEAVREPLNVRDAWDPQPEIDEDVAQARRRIANLGGIEARAAASMDGDPVEALAYYAESVDLLVLGSYAYRPTDSLLAGGTAQRLAAQAACPLLVLARDRVTPAS